MKQKKLFNHKEYSFRPACLIFKKIHQIFTYGFYNIQKSFIALTFMSDDEGRSILIKHETRLACISSFSLNWRRVFVDEIFISSSIEFSIVEDNFSYIFTMFFNALVFTLEISSIIPLFELSQNISPLPLLPPKKLRYSVF